MKKTIIALLTLACAASAVEELTLSDKEASFAKSYDLSQDWTMSVYLPGGFLPGGTAPSGLDDKGTSNVLKSSLLNISTWSTDSTVDVAIPSMLLTTGSDESVTTLQNLGETEWWNFVQFGASVIKLDYSGNAGSLTVGLYTILNGNLSDPYATGTYTSMIPGWKLTDESDFGSITGFDGTRVTFSGVEASIPSAQSIPEPTTATLSLLALAGLAARRRRK